MCDIIIRAGASRVEISPGARHFLGEVKLVVASSYIKMHQVAEGWEYELNTCSTGYWIK